MQVGASVSTISVGDRVVAPIGMIGCGTCKNCRCGRYSICLKPPKHEWAGAFVEYISIPYQAAYKLADNISFEVAPVIEPACVAYSAVRQAGVQLIENVTILGLGAIGLVATQCVRLLEPANLIATDVMNFRLGLARELGADVALVSRGKINLEPLCTHFFELDEIDKAFEAFARSKPIVLRNLRSFQIAAGRFTAPIVVLAHPLSV